MERQQDGDRKEGWTPALRMPDLLEEGREEGTGAVRPERDGGRQRRLAEVEWEGDGGRREDSW